MRKIKFRIVLPVLFGLVAAALIAWDYHNQQIIKSMGMDTDAPIWPYQMPWILLQTINVPALLVSAPFFFILDIYTLNAHYPLLFLSILLFWYWVGSRLDWGLLGYRTYRHPKRWAIFLIASAASLLGFAGWITWQDSWNWITYATRPFFPACLSLLPTAGIALWFLILSCGAALAAFRLLKGIDQKQTDVPPHIRLSKLHPVIIALIVVSAIFFSRIIDKKMMKPDEQVEDPTLGTISGSIVETNGKPIKDIGVDLIPTERKGDHQWTQIKREWTNKQGSYRFKDLNPGNYLLAVHKDEAPYGNHPFAKTFYPGVSNETEAGKIVVRSMSHIYLHPLSLQRLKTITLKIKVSWADGSLPAGSDLFIHNESYPKQPIIGNIVLGVEHGKRELILPLGYKYQATAYVDCSAGNKIDKRGSIPVKIDANADSFPGEIAFTIPGPACGLWYPK